MVDLAHGNNLPEFRRPENQVFMYEINASDRFAPPRLPSQSRNPRCRTRRSITSMHWPLRPTTMHHADKRWAVRLDHKMGRSLGVVRWAPAPAVSAPGAFGRRSGPQAILP